MDVVATARTEIIAEKKKDKKQKLKELKRKQKLENRTNQNVEISSNEKCCGIAEAHSYVGPAVDLEESSQVDRARAKELTEKKTKRGKSNKTSMNKCANQTNQNNEISNNEKCDAVAKSNSYVESAVESLLRGSSREERASNDSTESKRTTFKDEPQLELSNEESVLGDAGKENSHNETMKRKRKSKRRGNSKNELEAPKVDNVLANADEGKSQLRKKRNRCNSGSRATNKDGQVKCDQENKCLEISIDGKRCISAAESDINRVALTVNPLLQESAEVLKVSTEIVNESIIPEEKRKGKTKSKARKRDAKVILDENELEAPKVDNVLTNADEGKSQLREKRKRCNSGSRATNKDGQVICDQENKCLEISIDRKRCISVAESDINRVALTVDPLLQESAEVLEVSTEIVKENIIPEEKRKGKKKSKAGKRDAKVILDEKDECLKISVDSKNELEVPKVDNVLTNADEGKSQLREKRKRCNSGSLATNKDGQVICDQENKCLEISIDRKRCISVAESDINRVALTVEPLLQESAELLEVSTEIVKENIIPEEKRKGKKKSKAGKRDAKVILDGKDECLKISVDSKNELEVPKVDNILTNADEGKSQLREKRKRCNSGSLATNKDGQVICDQENKCLEISIDRKRCISVAESDINRVALSVDPQLQESTEVLEVSTDIVKENIIPEEKRKGKKKSKARKRDAEVILDEKNECLKISVDSKNELEAPKVDNVLTNADEGKSQLREKRKRCNSGSLATNKDGQVICDQENKCLEISIDRKRCISVAESDINRVALTVEPLLQESAELLEVSTEIVKENIIPEEKRKGKKKSKAGKRDAKVILDGKDECLKISVDSKNELEVPKVDNILTNADEGKSQLREKRKRCNSGSLATNKDGQVICDQENKCLEISIDRKRCISVAESDINRVALSVDPQLQESTEVLEVSTDIVKENIIPEEKRKGKKKSKARKRDAEVILDEKNECLKISVDSKNELEAPKVDNVLTNADEGKSQLREKRKRCNSGSLATNKDGQVICDQENKCLEISIDRKRCISVAESDINRVALTVEPLLQESAEVLEVSSEIVKENIIPEEKRKGKKKSKARKRDAKVIIDENDECLKISVDSKSCIAASELRINVEESVDHLLQESPEVEEVSIEITKEKKTPNVKQKQKKKLKARDRDGNTILDKENNCLEIPVDRRSCISASESCIKGEEEPLLKEPPEAKEVTIDAPRSKFLTDNVSSLAISGNGDLPNDFYQLPRRELTTCSRRILLVLDINGLLADIVMPAPKNQKPDTRMCGRAIFKRPYCDDFLNFCFDTFDVGIWSSRSKRIIDIVVEYLLGERKQKLLFCWDMSHTTVSKFKTLDDRHKPLVCKGLRNLWEKRYPALPWEKGDYTESNTLLIDDSPYKALLNPMHTAIFPRSFTYKDQHDNSIGPGGELRVYLQNLAKTNDVRKYVEEHPFGQCAITEKSPSWNFYSKVINSLSKYN